MDSPILIIVIIAAIALIPLVWFIATFNRFAGLRQHMREAWSDIDVELKRRHDLIPNLVNVVKGYAAHERQVLERVIELRNRAAAEHRSPRDLAEDESILMHEVQRLLLLVERYPTLKADGHFRALQEELALTEDRIAAARRFYNGNVRELNTLRESFPSSIVGSMFGFQAAEFFELDAAAERVVPRIAFER